MVVLVVILFCLDFETMYSAQIYTIALGLVDDL